MQVLASISGAEDGAINPAAWVERHARRRPDDPALAEGDRVCASWGEFAARTAGAASGLRDHFGLSPGDRVAIVMRNRPEYLEALFAIWHAGLVAVPVNARLHRDEIAYILEHSESALAVTDADHVGDIESLVGTVASLKAAVVAPGERWDRLTASSPARLAGGQPEDPAWLFYTSGTTGRPKGATLTHRSLLMATLSYFADIDPVQPQDCILHAAPLSHGAGLYGLPHVARGAVSVVPQSGLIRNPDKARVHGDLLVQAYRQPRTRSPRKLHVQPPQRPRSADRRARSAKSRPGRGARRWCRFRSAACGCRPARCHRGPSWHG